MAVVKQLLPISAFTRPRSVAACALHLSTATALFCCLCVRAACALSHCEGLDVVYGKQWVRRDCEGKCKEAYVCLVQQPLAAELQRQPALPRLRLRPLVLLLLRPAQAAQAAARALDACF